MNNMINVNIDLMPYWASENRYLSYTYCYFRVNITKP